MDTQQALQLAFQHLNGGNLGAAAQLFNGVLQQEPQNFAALNGRGFVALQQNALPQAQADLQASLSINPKQPFAHKMLGIVLGAMGQFDAAMQAFAAALALDAKDAEIYFNRANFRFQAGQVQDALADLDAAIKLKGSYLEARSNRANLLIQLGEFARAEKDLDYLVAKVTNNPDLWVALGLVRHRVGKHQGSMQCNERALKLVPNHPDALLNSSSAMHDQGEYPAALAWADKAIVATPQRAEAHYAKAQALIGMHRFEDAVAAYTRSIELNPGYAEAWMGRGLAKIRLLAYQDAIHSFDRVGEIKGDDPEMWINRGMALAELGQYESAIEAYKKCLILDPNNSKAFNNLGLAQAGLRNFDEAFDSYRKALEIDPDMAAASLNQSLAYLSIGNYQDGWVAYESRYRKAKRPREFDKPLWLGNEDISDKTILLHAEQGLGDTLQFCRYVNSVAFLCKEVILSVPETLTALCQTLISSPIVISTDEEIPEFDFHCPLMSLPLAMGTQIETIPTQVPYLYANKEKLLIWKERLASISGLKVGLTWNSGFQRNPDEMDGSNAGRNISLARRNVPLNKLRELIIPGVRFISLQKGKNSEQELLEFNNELEQSSKVLDYVSELKDFSDTAALVASLDLIISVDTSVAHLSGALGKPTWVMNRYDSCWRWLPVSENSLWYPTARVYHQQKFNDWDSVINLVKKDLENIAVDS